MTLGSRRHTAFSSLIHDLTKRSRFIGPFTLGNAKKSPKRSEPKLSSDPLYRQRHILGKNGSSRGTRVDEWFPRTPAKVNKSKLSSRTADFLLENKQRFIRHFSFSKISMLSRPPGWPIFARPALHETVEDSPHPSGCEPIRQLGQVFRLSDDLTFELFS